MPREASSVRRDFAQGSYNLAYITMSLADYASAEEHIGNALSNFELVLVDDVEDLQTEFDLANCQRMAGKISSSWLIDDAARGREFYVKAVRHFANAMLTSMGDASPR